MKTRLKKTWAVAALGLACCVFTVNSQAELIGINGSASITNDGVQGSVQDLLGEVDLTVYNQKLALVGNSGDMLILNGNTHTIEPGAKILHILAGEGSNAIANVNDFDIGLNDFGFGSFDAISAQVVGVRTSNFLDILVVGMYTSGNLVGKQVGGCATAGNTCQATEASFRWSFTRSGASFSGSSTFSSPAQKIVPEPASWCLMGLGFAGLAAMRKNKLNY